MNLADLLDAAGAELQEFSTATASSIAFYPVAARLTPLVGTATDVQLRVKEVKSQRGTNEGIGSINLERLPQYEGFFPPAITPRVGDRLLVSAPSDMLNQEFEIVEPIRADSLGYRTGLSFVSGVR